MITLKVFYKAFLLLSFCYNVSTTSSIPSTTSSVPSGVPDTIEFEEDLQTVLDVLMEEDTPTEISKEPADADGTYQCEEDEVISVDFDEFVRVKQAELDMEVNIHKITGGITTINCDSDKLTPNETNFDQEKIKSLNICDEIKNIDKSADEIHQHYKRQRR